MIPFFAEKIKSICDFYRAKRNEVSLVVHKNKFKGSRKSIEEIIYEKIIDFFFNNKDLTPQVSDLQKNLIVSLEEYVDIYSEYFDIPRKRECTDESRKKMLEANINNVDYRDYLNVSSIISDLIYSGEIYLKEIPLIAQVGLDLSAECAGDLEELRQNLLNNATLNQIPLNEQVSIKRKLYEKLLGCDLYYIYSDNNCNLTQDILVKASNPSGNLLNCGSADMALYESESIELLSHIGLFFKPDKLGILKINTDNFTWSIDSDKIKPDTFYVFPDPSKYGDMGNNKDSGYPLVFEYKLDSVIKNLSSGLAKDDPLSYISSTTWNTYYSKQDNDYKLIKNDDFKYSFTSLANIGWITNYQIDMFGNEYGLFKGIIKEGNKLIIPSKSCFPKIEIVDGKSKEEITSSGNNILFNGGYFVDPRYPTTNEKIGRQFQHNERIRVKDDYLWTGFTFKPQSFFTPDNITKHIQASGFSDTLFVQYVDHYGVVPSITNTEEATNENMTTHVFNNFVTSIAEDLEIEEKDYTLKDLQEMPGMLYLKDNTANMAPFLISEDVKDFVLIGNTLFIIKDKVIFTYKYEYENKRTVFTLINAGITFDDGDYVKILYNETEDVFFILCLSPVELEEAPGRFFFNVNITKYNPEEEKFTYNFIDYSPTFNMGTQEIENDNFEYIDKSSKIMGYTFSYNNNLNLYLISYILNDGSNTPYIYQHTFRLFDADLFKSSLESCVYTNIIDNKIYGVNSTISSPSYFKYSNNTIAYKNLTFFIKTNGQR